MVDIEAPESFSVSTWVVFLVNRWIWIATGKYDVQNMTYCKIQGRPFSHLLFALSSCLYDNTNTTKERTTACFT
jgi:hypothetical protein